MALGIISILGTVGTFYFGYLSVKLDRARRRFTWSDLQTAVREISDQAQRNGFHPDIVYTLSPRGAAILVAARAEFGIHVPLFCGLSEGPHQGTFRFQPHGYHRLNTHSDMGAIYIPSGILEHTDKKVLIVDDCVLTGNSLNLAKTFLIEHGFNLADVRTSAVICTKGAKSSHNAPDYYWIETGDTDFFFPWGRTWA